MKGVPIIAVTNDVTVRHWREWTTCVVVYHFDIPVTGWRPQPCPIR